METLTKQHLRNWVDGGRRIERKAEFEPSQPRIQQIVLFLLRECWQNMVKQACGGAEETRGHFVS